MTSRALRSTLLIAVLASAGCSGSGGDDSETQDLDGDLAPAFGGDLSISGTLTLPSVPQGDGAGFCQLGVQAFELDGTPKSSAASPAGYAKKETLTYILRGLVSGRYKLQARVDANGPAQEIGDFVGLFPGTVDAPIQDEAQAEEIVVDGASVSDIDFGIGLEP